MILLKRLALNVEAREIQSLEETIKVMRSSAMRVINIWFGAKKKSLFHQILLQIRAVGNMRQFDLNNRHRKGLRIITRIYLTKSKQVWNILRSTRVIQYKSMKTKAVFMIVKEARAKILKYSVVKLQRNYYLSRKDKIEEEIKELNEKLEDKEDEEIKALREKQDELNNQLE